MAEIPWDELDPGIKPVVAELVAAGFDTYASCQGGEGHASTMPEIMLTPTKGDAEFTRVKVTEWLERHGLAGCYVSVTYSCHPREFDEGGPYSGGPWVTIQWWSKGIIERFVRGN